MDIIYVIFYKGEIYKGLPGNKCRSAYLKPSTAKAIISYDVKHWAQYGHYEAWDKYTEQQRQELIIEERKFFEIREFTWNGNIN